MSNHELGITKHKETARVTERAKAGLNKYGDRVREGAKKESKAADARVKPEVQPAEDAPKSETQDKPAEESRAASYIRRANDRRPAHRAKPGAALALAQREKVAIVPSQGTRMTFT